MSFIRIMAIIFESWLNQFWGAVFVCLLEGGHYWSKLGVGGGAEKVLSMLKWGGGRSRGQQNSTL